VAFNVSADAYDRFMGRYSHQLSAQMADLAGVRHGQIVIDVGCGPGVLTAELVGRLGAEAVTAVDPSAQFVEAAKARHPGVTVAQAYAEDLPFADGAFDAAIAQLVVHFMADPVAGLAEMKRVTRPGGSVAACVWDHAADGRGPLSTFWQVAHELNRNAPGEQGGAGAREGHLAQLFAEAGLGDVESTLVTSTVEHPSFEEWWEPYNGSVGPAGAYVASLDAAGKARLREACRARLGAGPFTVSSRAWAARGLA
jgi:SAM-dependent methyltransferase